MKTTKIYLEIDHSKYLTIEFKGAIKDLYLLDDITVVYHENKKKYILQEYDCVAGPLRDFNFDLNTAIKHELVAHESIDHDLGYLWNEYLQNKKGHNFVEAPLEEDSTFWVGLRNLVLSSQQYETWLYNKNGAIYLEITPGYKWHFLKPKKNEQYISYNKFIKNYKPIAIIKLEEKVAQQWLKTISELVKIAQNNFDRLEELGKNGFYFIEHLCEQKEGSLWRTFKNSKRLGTFDQPLGKRIGN